MVVLTSGRLTELAELDRSLLHLFVAGPGEGEGIAVALPGSGWLMVDGCRTGPPRRREFPLEHVWKRWSGPQDRVEALNTAYTGAARTWLVTPYNRGRLPRFGPAEGAHLLLRREPRLMLTAMPASKTSQPRHPPPARLRRGDLRSRADTQSAGNPFVDGGTDLRPTGPVGPLDAVWCVAFDADGGVRRRWRGAVAFDLLP